jgi:hypothetical protein
LAPKDIDLNAYVAQLPEEGQVELRLFHDLLSVTR